MGVTGRRPVRLPNRPLILQPARGRTTAENPKRQRQKRCLLETANTCTQKLRTRPCGVFAVSSEPCGDWGLEGLGLEASPDKWGRLHSVHGLDDGVMIFRPTWWGLGRFVFAQYLKVFWAGGRCLSQLV